MKVYLASALKNNNLNSEINKLLERSGWDVFLPQRDNDQNAKPHVVAKQNTEEIVHADVVIVVGRGLGRDTSWEIGFAQGSGKATIILVESSSDFEEDIMIKHGFPHHAVIEYNASEVGNVIVDVQRALEQLAVRP